MLVVWMLFGALVAGPLLVLGTLALANSDRAMAWLSDVRRRWLPSSVVTTPGVASPGADRAEATRAAMEVDGASTQ